MAGKLRFTKMQGAGNDYIYVDCFRERLEDPGAVAAAISDRHFGVGSDGLVLALPSEKADLAMRMFNADGTEAEMCGNAARCVAKFAYDRGLVDRPELALETAAGIKKIRLLFDEGQVAGARVDMGAPILDPARVPALFSADGNGRCVGAPLEVDGNVYKVTAVSMGNPHAVLFMEGIDSLNLPVLGPLFENNAMFPRRVNTEFVEVLSRDAIKMRVWERGAGETLACGTGACAALVACVLNGLTGRKARVELKGGNLEIEWNETDGHVYMAGPAVEVFTGEYPL